MTMQSPFPFPRPFGDISGLWKQRSLALVLTGLVDELTPDQDPAAACLGFPRDGRTDLGQQPGTVALALAVASQ